ncbi:hypothetical protein H5410_041880 [Solanum commersonii]|uniref:indole-3-pyruvate monooxygenase n=1 Tax=Solanum commersonii TaxID=4109 RepID=A0A9J5XWW6_SOLCO|nr:hypothetical protein H5410_041880 [Solanum commersonii]
MTNLQSYFQTNMLLLEVEVVVVGVGTLGIAISACLNKFNIKNVVLEKEDCCAYLWKKKTYDRLNLHLAKGFCSLPFMPHTTSTLKYLSKMSLFNT